MAGFGETQPVSKPLRNGSFGAKSGLNPARREPANHDPDIGLVVREQPVKRDQVIGTQ
jgi:hypothetical protein